MRFASASGAINGDVGDAVRKLADQAGEALGTSSADLVVAFVSSHFEDEAERMGQTLASRFPTSVILGCSGESVIGPQKEYERTPAVSLMLAHLPGVELCPFRLAPPDLADEEMVSVCAQTVDVPAPEQATFILLGDPFSVPIQPVLASFNEHFPGRPVFGGMVSGCDRPGQAVLILDGDVHRDGVVGLALSGRVEVDGVVSQGCRPIGNHFIITRCQRNIILELGGKPALTRLREVLESLPPEEAGLARQSLFVGQVINEYQEQFVRGDFLIRNLLAIDPQSGAIAVNDEVRRGATIKFHVRDGATADEDLRLMLQRQRGAGAASGALVFSCNGRGTRMWPQPNHDVALLNEVFPAVPVAGFFAAGELGPVGERNFIHGHTASVAIFREPTSATDPQAQG